MYTFILNLRPGTSPTLSAHTALPLHDYVTILLLPSLAENPSVDFWNTESLMQLENQDIIGCWLFRLTELIELNVRIK